MGEFIVSARKYRPATFSTVVGQNHITSTLKNAIERGQLAHAYLFCGPRGVGKTTCARIFAKAINCLSPNGAEACNECESCRSFNENRSLNIHELDAASNNSVDDIRSLIEQVRIIPQLGKYALFIIDEVHMLSAAAFNAFLKTLEEPPAHAIFILATTEKHKILPTILSRCQIFDFNRIKVEDGVHYLRYIADKESVTADEESLNLIAQKADGGMRDALSMFDKAVSFCGTTLDYKHVAQTLNILDYDTYFTVVESLIAGNYVEALLAFDAVLSQGFSSQTFMAGLNAHARDLLVAKDPASLKLMEYTEALCERYRAQSERCSVGLLFSMMSILTDADGKLRQSSNQRLLVELGLMKIAGLGQKKNNGVGNYTDLEPSLPDLDSEAARTMVQKVLSERLGTGVVAEELPKPQTVVEVAPKEPTPEVTQEPKAPTKVAPKRLAKPLFSLTDALEGRSERSEVVSESADDANITVDERSEQLIKEYNAQILTYIESWRPRFADPFKEMSVCNNRIAVKVSSQDLKVEIERAQSELLYKIVEITGIKGVLYLDIVVDETVVARRPIKLEDRIAYLVNLNPKIVELKSKFSLYVE